MQQPLSHLGFLSVIAFLITPLPAQTTTYDDFSGSTVDRAKWFRFGDLTKISQANGSLRLFGRGFNDRFEVAALRGIRGTTPSFEIDLHYHGFKAGDPGSRFALFIYQPGCLGGKRVEGEASIGMGAWRNTSNQILTGFDADYDVTINGRQVNMRRSVAHTATSGVVRVQRAGTKLNLMYSVSNPPRFQTLLSEPNFFRSGDIIFSIENDTNDNQGMAVDVECKEILVNGPLTPSGKLQTFGNRCWRLGAIGTLPKSGQAVAILGIGDRSFRGELAYLGIGLQNSRLQTPFSWPGSPGCSLYLNPLLVLVGRMDSGGEWILSVCSNPLPPGTVLNFQFAARTNRNSGGIAFSNLVRWEAY